MDGLLGGVGRVGSSEGGGVVDAVGVSALVGNF